ncbi:MAG: DUF58 domain-containing protein [Planctomycetota bacterium]
MIPPEIFAKVRLLEIRSRKAVNDLLAGEYHSAFKGRGIEFEEVREYVPGDDVRTIDWNVTARLGTPFVKSYREERELTVCLLVDVSASGDFGTAGTTKLATAAEICALLAFAAVKNNDKVGLLMFGERVERYIPPKKGRRHVLRVIRELLSWRVGRGGTDIRQALDYFMKVQKKKCIAFLVSDFIDAGFDRTLAMAGRRHDLVALHMSDPREVAMPDLGIAAFTDVETGEEVEVDLGRPEVRAVFEESGIGEVRQLEGTLRASGVDSVTIRTGRDYVAPLDRLFRRRAR